MAGVAVIVTLSAAAFWLRNIARVLVRCYQVFATLTSDYLSVHELLVLYGRRRRSTGTNRHNEITTEWLVCNSRSHIMRQRWTATATVRWCWADVINPSAAIQLSSHPPPRRHQHNVVIIIIITDAEAAANKTKTAVERDPLIADRKLQP